MSASSLAYIGDAVFELYIRTQELIPVRKIREYHLSVVSFVKAESQAEMAKHIRPLLTEHEADVFRRGRNAADGKPKRVSLSTYQQATGFEALLGFLYLTDAERLMEILNYCAPRQEGG